jgi:putative acetyltransferase
MQPRLLTAFVTLAGQPRMPSFRQSRPPRPADLIQPFLWSETGRSQSYREEIKVFMPATIDAERPDTAEARGLIEELERYLASLYPPESRHGYSVEKLIGEAVSFFLIRNDGIVVGCGGIQLFGAEYGEVKRMYVRPQFRGLGLGKLMLDHLTDYARSRGVGLLRLETGIHQHAAIKLYERSGFRSIPPFGPYKDDPLSKFYEKRIV